jgi:hypothetical protein
MVNLYSVVGVISETEIQVRPHMHTTDPALYGVLFLDEQPVAKVHACVDASDLGVGDYWTVYLDRQVSNILIGNLVGIGTP